MPYKNNLQLPEQVRNTLPDKAQSIWRNVFNSADKKGSSEISAIKQAWGAVKNAGYEKQKKTGKYIKKSKQDAPNYRLATDINNCSICFHAIENDICELYDFKFKRDWICDSWKPLLEKGENMEKEFDIKCNVEITKIDEEKQMVFGIFNLFSQSGDPIEDRQGDIILKEDVHEFEKAVYDYVLNARIAGERHIRKGVGELVESVFLDETKQKAIISALNKADVPNPVMSLNSEFWWGGFKVTDDDVWEKVKNGDYPMFSIGGSGTRKEIE